MENKNMQATTQRPEGNRVLNAPMLKTDLNSLIVQLKNEKAWADSDRNAITIFKSDIMRIVLIGLKQDAVLSEHIARGDISVQVLEGNLAFVANEQTNIFAKGEIIVLQESVPHSLTANTESFFLLTLAMTA